MEKPIIIAPHICLPTMKEVKAKGKEQEAVDGKRSARDKSAQVTPKKKRKSTSK
ncbi:hypothetical protein CLV24_105125 [Pontibacter ummariensis]|uniref:Uncharacterized protein n=1 Tax=Pontibacter ummariensis TaxID=1610492 RepID=A0A239DUD3_9BACT|nr:hypothetical protein [Pontibacter ummariensis]PRY13755.1 hypothetical protein CLV24_105125 [Pontibacter ummariensis]SNS35947.1 hypothetical protein SAMN06296052_105127 [Pontibacter ummariensis]